MKETVCVTGGSGGIGRALLEELVGRYHVKALFRTKTVVTDDWERRGCIPVLGDLSDEDALAELVRGASVVFHCAALTAQASYEDSYAVNVEGTRRLARAAAAHGCRRFVHVSTVAVYTGARSGGDYTEDLELHEHGDMPVYAVTKLKAERALEEIARGSRLEYTILRPTCVYGPHTKPFTVVPIELLRKGWPIVIGSGNGLMDAVYVKDVAQTLVLAAESPNASGEVFNIGHESVTYNDFYGHYARMLNRKARHVPIALLRIIIRLLTAISGTPGSPRDQLRRGIGYLADAACNTRRFPSVKAAALLGYRPRFSLCTGMLSTEVWARREYRVEQHPDVVTGMGPLPFRPFAVASPATEREISQAIQIAAENGLKVKAIGSLHSFSPIPETDGICLVLDQYNKCVAVDGSLVTVQAGMRLRDLFDTLATLNLALPTNGSIREQTVSGAISTATHGGSVLHASVSDCVEAVRIVKADGTVADVDRSEPVFAGVIVSLGVLGVVSTVAFRCVPAFALTSRRSVRNTEEVIDRFDEVQKESAYTCICYFPVADEMEILSVDRIEGAEGRSIAVSAPVTARLRAKTAVEQRVATAAVKALAWLLLRHRSIQRFFTRFLVGRTYPLRKGRSDWVLAISDVAGTSRRSQRIVQDMEVAVPYEQAPAAIRALRNHFMTTRMFPLLSIHVRCSARSDLWLSPAYGRTVCYLEFWQLAGADDLFARMHDVLKPFRYRFHWGKETRADRMYTRCQYERWDDFLRLREAWDPEGMFLNAYVESFLSTTGVLETA